MTSTEEIAEFVAGVTYDRLPEATREAAKRRILDSIAVGLRGHDTGAVAAVKSGLTPAGGRSESRPWGSPSTASAPRAAMLNAASIVAGNGPTFLSPTPVPAGGSIAAVLAVAEARGATGEQTLAGLAAAFELHGELAWHVPMDRLHPATHTAVAGAAGTGRAGGLDRAELQNALGIAASRITLGIGDGAFGPIAAGNAAAQGVYAHLLAEGGVSVPDGLAAPDGWHDLVGPFDIDLDPGCERVLDAGVLPYDSHLYGQPTIEAAIDLAKRVALDPADIESINVETAEKATGEIDRDRVAAAVVDRALSVHRGDRADLRPIADATTVSAIEGTREHPDVESLPARVTVETYDGDVYEETTGGFEGHPATPASWGTVEEKFHALAGEKYDRDRREEIVETVRGFEAESPTELARLLD